jgi:hypothetical protein
MSVLDEKELKELRDGLPGARRVHGNDSDPEYGYGVVEDLLDTVDELRARLERVREAATEDEPPGDGDWLDGYRSAMGCIMGELDGEGET